MIYCFAWCLNIAFTLNVSLQINSLLAPVNENMSENAKNMIIRNVQEAARSRPYDKKCQPRVNSWLTANVLMAIISFLCMNFHDS